MYHKVRSITSQLRRFHRRASSALITFALLSALWALFSGDLHAEHISRIFALTGQFVDSLIKSQEDSAKEDADDHQRRS